MLCVFDIDMFTMEFVKHFVGLAVFISSLGLEEAYRILVESKFCYLGEIIMNKGKRPSESKTEYAETKSKQSKHWSLGLLESMKDPECVVRKTESVVVIRDKFPKARFHYLVLPKENISSIMKLDKSHINLLEEFGMLYEELQETHKDVNLRAGFHAVPSMFRLHMHVISKDMISPCLKTKAHWNSFTTKFFLPYQDVLEELEESGVIKKMSTEEHKSLMATPLVCNQCSFKPKNMPQLKEHLLSHSLM